MSGAGALHVVVGAVVAVGACLVLGDLAGVAQALVPIGIGVVAALGETAARAELIKLLQEQLSLYGHTQTVSEAQA